ncbi:uncharacterized protein [Gossypium hirsutum]|uniref:Uncharacterized protein n=1 Tax=Gossypium hirsutum TaxID=3635 RepID=A0A1U8ITI8_GOSHI|nr:uncharacterized protein LOC107900204 [Gossypium hirsutum]
MKDLGSFTITCNIGESYYIKALCDIRVNINLMPKSIFKMLGIGKVRPVTVTLQLADQSFTYLVGKIEDVLVCVDKFIFPANFIVLDFKADKEVSIILERPFLATGRTLIDMQKGELTMRVQDDQVTFNVLKAMKLPNPTEDYSIMEELETFISMEWESNFVEDPLGNTIRFEPLEDEEGNESIALIKANPNDYVQPTQFEPLALEAQEFTQPKLSIEKPPKLELKVLLSHLKYAYLGNNSTLSVIISAELTNTKRSS